MSNSNTVNLKENKHLLVVDGHGLLFQMFFGIPGRILGKHNKVVTGTIGFVSIVLKMINQLAISHVIVVFDAQQELNNKEINPDYKANRPDWTNVLPEENPFSQLEDIEKALNYLNINFVYSSNGFEADDYISSIVKKHQNQFDNLYILSKDTDFYQILSDKILMVKYAGKNTKLFSEKEVFNSLGIYPKHYAFFKSLTGDNADNIKGINTIGKVTAKKIIDSYPTISHLFENFSTLTPRLQNALKDKKSTLETNLKLIEFDSLLLENINLKNLAIKQSFKTISAGKVLRQLDII